MTDAADTYRDTWGTLVDPPETADERQAAIVAWLRTIGKPQIADQRRNVSHAKRDEGQGVEVAHHDDAVRDFNRPAATSASCASPTKRSASLKRWSRIIAGWLGVQSGPPCSTGQPGAPQPFLCSARCQAMPISGSENTDGVSAVARFISGVRLLAI